MEGPVPGLLNTVLGLTGCFSCDISKIWSTSMLSASLERVDLMEPSASSAVLELLCNFRAEQCQRLEFQSALMEIIKSHFKLLSNTI